MRETSKCQKFRRDRGDFQNYLCGKGIDVGCGNDCLKVDSGSVRPWDVSDGDAQLMAGVPDAEYDFVYNYGMVDHTGLDGLAQLCIVAQKGQGA